MNCSLYLFFKATETPVTETPQSTEVKVEAEKTLEQIEASTESTEAEVKKEGEEPKTEENGTSETAESDDGHPKLFVGRLPVGTKETQLKELFVTYGEVTHCDIVGKYGFVVSHFVYLLLLC